MAWDFRIHAAVCALTGLLLAWRGTAGRDLPRKNRPTRGVRPRAIWPLVVLLVGLAVVLRLGLMLTADPSSIERRGQSNVGRLFGLEVGLRTVLHSPLLGYGSWGHSAELSAIQRDVLHDSAEYAQVAGPVEGGLAVSVHSAILQVWVEAGVLGAAALLLLGWRLLAWMRAALVDRPLDRLTPVLAYSWIYALWNLVNSGFLGRSRLAFAIVGALVVMVMAEWQRRHRRRPRVDAQRSSGVSAPARGLGH
jgi:O-antigen ligase